MRPCDGILRSSASSVSWPFSSIVMMSFWRSSSVDQRSIVKSTVAVPPVPILLMFTAQAVIPSVHRRCAAPQAARLP